MKKKALGLLILLVIYLLAAVIGMFTYIGFNKLGLNDYLAILLADVIATIFVWITGVILKTASTYDPYWSLQTLVIYTCFLVKYNNWNIGTILLLIAIFVYSFRLTLNFIIGFDSLNYIDWRYRMLKEKTGKLYQVVNLLGICMFPTLVVYACSLPAIKYATITEFHILDIIGVIIILLGVLIEFIADGQMKKFIKVRSGRHEVINIGLWNYSRHPNYLGEISIWYGVAFTLILARFNYWYFMIGAFINLLMFLIISIPMEERHLKEYKENYEDYLNSTHMLLILPKRKK